MPALAGPEFKNRAPPTRTQGATLADPVIKSAALPEPEVNVSPLEAADDVAVPERRVYRPISLVGLYENARQRSDTIKVEERIKVTVERRTARGRTVTKTVTKLVEMRTLRWKDPDARTKRLACR